MTMMVMTVLVVVMIMPTTVDLVSVMLMTTTSALFAVASVLPARSVVGWGNERDSLEADVASAEHEEARSKEGPGACGEAPFPLAPEEEIWHERRGQVPSMAGDMRREDGRTRSGPGERGSERGRAENESSA
jgi:hypothetical protein